MAVFNNNTVLDLPDISKINFTKIDKNYFNVICINFFTLFAIILIGLIVLHQFVFNEGLKNYIVLIYALFLVFFGGLYFLLLMSFSKRKYALRDKDISYKSGFYVKKMTTVPFSRIQHVEIDESFISRMFNLAAISVFTAGDSSDDLVIKGIAKEKALQLKEFITTKINE